MSTCNQLNSVMKTTFKNPDFEWKNIAEQKLVEQIPKQ